MPPKPSRLANKVPYPNTSIGEHDPAAADASSLGCRRGDPTARPDDWQRVKDLRLRALQGKPDAYGSTYRQEAEADEAAWRSWASGWSNAADQALFASAEGGL